MEVAMKSKILSHSYFYPLIFVSSLLFSATSFYWHSASINYDNSLTETKYGINLCYTRMTQSMIALQSFDYFSKQLERSYLDMTNECFFEFKEKIANNYGTQATGLKLVEDLVDQSVNFHKSILNVLSKRQGELKLSEIQSQVIPIFNKADLARYQVNQWLRQIESQKSSTSSATLSLILSLIFVNALLLWMIWKKITFTQEMHESDRAANEFLVAEKDHVVKIEYFFSQIFNKLGLFACEQLFKVYHEQLVDRSFAFSAIRNQGKIDTNSSTPNDREKLSSGFNVLDAESFDEDKNFANDLTWQTIEMGGDLLLHKNAINKNDSETKKNNIDSVASNAHNHQDDFFDNTKIVNLLDADSKNFKEVDRADLRLHHAAPKIENATQANQSYVNGTPPEVSLADLPAPDIDLQNKKSHHYKTINLESIRSEANLLQQLAMDPAEGLLNDLHDIFSEINTRSRQEDPIGAIYNIPDSSARFRLKGEEELQQQLFYALLGKINSKFDDFSVSSQQRDIQVSLRFDAVSSMAEICLTANGCLFHIDDLEYFLHEDQLTTDSHNMIIQEMLKELYGKISLKNMIGESLEDKKIQIMVTLPAQAYDIAFTQREVKISSIVKGKKKEILQNFSSTATKNPKEIII